MRYQFLGKSNLAVSSIGLGCVTFGREIDEAAAYTIMDRALEAGITLFDTAEVYGGNPGRSEEIIGRWLAGRRTRPQIVLATKVRPPLGRERIIASAEASLRRLQVEVIDLFQMHAWDNQTPLDETLEALELLAQQGKVRHVGFSNCAAWQLCKALWYQERAGWGRLESVQPPYNLVVRDIERELLPLCADQQVSVLAYSPLGSGFLTGKYRPGGEILKGTRMEIVPGTIPSYFHDAGFRIVDGLRRKAEQIGAPIPALALAWVMAEPRVTSVLIGARSAAQIDQALQADALGISAELRAELSAL
ncbi:MAG: aldo/keto reductase [Chloroflexi bacterium]|nr:aldo/keto reductase [Chloroflexota bacterium]